MAIWSGSATNSGGRQTNSALPSVVTWWPYTVYLWRTEPVGGLDRDAD